MLSICPVSLRRLGGIRRRHLARRAGAIWRAVDTADVTLWGSLPGVRRGCDGRGGDGDGGLLPPAPLQVCLLRAAAKGIPGKVRRPSDQK
eukprot:2803246-Pyramimonas_sp.AAC.1